MPTDIRAKIEDHKLRARQANKAYLRAQKQWMEYDKKASFYKQKAEAMHAQFLRNEREKNRLLEALRRSGRKV